MRARWPVLAVVVGWSLACASAPEDTRQGREVLAFLEHARTGDDGKAVSLLRLPYDAPVPFGPVELGKRADRMRLLRTHDRVELTKVARIRSSVSRPNDPLGELVLRGITRLNPVYEVEGILWKGTESADFDLRVSRDGLWEIRFAGVRLIPRSNYRVIPAPPPVDEAPELAELEVGFVKYGQSWFAEVKGELNAASKTPSLALTTTCEEGDRVVRHATVSGHADSTHIGWRPFSLSDRLGPKVPDSDRPQRCELHFVVGQSNRRQQITWCLYDTGFREGACPVYPQPVASPDPISVDEVSAELDETGLVVRYALTPHEPMPVRYNTPDGAHLATEVSCTTGSLDVHRRPLHEEDDVPGVWRRNGSVLVEPSGVVLDPPCAIRLRFVRDDGFDRQEHLAWEGCLGADGLETGACP